MKSLYLLTLVVVIISATAIIRGKSETVSDTRESIKIKDDLFEALVQYEKSNGLHFNRPQDFKRLKIDPRMVKASYKCCTHIPNFVDESDLASLSKTTLVRHRNILKKLGVPETDALRDQKCIFSGGLPEPPPQDHAQKKQASDDPNRCEEKGFFLTVFFSQPALNKRKNGGSAENSNQLDNESKKCWRVLAFEYTSYSRFIYALYLVKDTKKGWKIVRKKRLYGVFS